MIIIVDHYQPTNKKIVVDTVYGLVYYTGTYGSFDGLTYFSQSILGINDDLFEGIEQYISSNVGA